MSKKKVVLGVTGSIAAYKSAEIVRQLIKHRFDVSVVMTKEAQAFITPLTLGVLSRNKVYCEMFDSFQDWDVEHISLADAAHVVLIAPATAHVIARLAAGLCDDLLTCLVAATKAPIVLAPAMNDRMYHHKITQDNIKRLEKIGYTFIGPKAGELACGREAAGCLAEVGDIIKVVTRCAA